MSKFEYLKLADAVASEIANGALKPGDRLPPQRSFAYQRKIAVSTASRVYTELLRRGLVVGEVGRGTFVSGETRRGVAMPIEPRGARIDLEVNYPHAADAIGDDRQKPGRAGAARSARSRVATGVQHRHAGRTHRFGGISRARGLVAELRSSSSSPPTEGNASPPRLRRWCRPAAAAASRR